MEIESISLLESLEICIIGMVLVGLFLTLMIGVMNASFKIISKYFKDDEQDDKALIAAIVASIQNK